VAYGDAPEFGRERAQKVFGFSIICVAPMGAREMWIETAVIFALFCG
jgi:hypothetical protein